jgi:hypothetical protein
LDELSSWSENIYSLVSSSSEEELVDEEESDMSFLSGLYRLSDFYLKAIWLITMKGFND